MENFNSIQSTVIYRMPREKDFFSLTSNLPFEINKKIETGFFFSNFDNGDIYSISNPETSKNTWPSFEIESNNISESSDKEEYLEKINLITKEIESSNYNKVVFSRIKNIVKPEDFLLENTFNSLCDKYPNAFIYCVSSKETGTWVGASPELLLNKDGENYKTVSLAGTRTNEANWTEKEREEQQVVTDYISEKIKPFSSSIKISEPYDLNTGAVIHLKSDISFKLNSNTDFWNLINQLNPTPAVCGIPTKKAKDFIANNESHKREIYTGFIGPLGINNHHSLFVNLRNMKIGKTKFSLYLGGGIMGNSIAEDEWQETENKARTLLSVL